MPAKRRSEAPLRVSLGARLAALRPLSSPQPNICYSRFRRYAVDRRCKHFIPERGERTAGGWVVPVAGRLVTDPELSAEILFAAEKSLAADQP